MDTFTVTKVRKELSSDGSHRHIAGVCTSGGTYYTRRQVVDSINAGNSWNSSSGGYTAKIQTMAYCPRTGCLAAPYIKTKPDSTAQDNLENLPTC